ncbi:cupin domain-containing protein [Rhodococcus sp. G-MC3]|uniref:cupin domain-containing protein n=1 Tax=Rhodococcus sp. G-MC3 TaxID=3046209 RepID=UPI0024BA64D4|nr:cupin domain-containing protein [Rhodococcus sp. G-MC3]MDJ0395835.1 cupin domain-containing protein [Rhodococcus sp. G-MC3]
MTSTVYRAADAPTVWLSSDVYSVTVRGEATGGAFSLTDGWVPPGGGPPPHVHLDATELIYVHTGEVAIVIEDIERTAGPGDTAVITPGTVHWFRNRTAAPARVLFVFTPPGTEEFFIQAGTPASPGVAVPLATDDDNARASEIGLRFGLAPGNGQDLPHDERTVV